MKLSNNKKPIIIIRGIIKVIRGLLGIFRIS